MSDEYVTSIIGAPDAASAERLAILAEEAGEIVQVIGKILRHGWDNRSPGGTTIGNGHLPTNREALMHEIGDLNEVCARMVHAGEISPDPILQASKRKHEKLKTWTHHQPDSLHPAPTP